MAEAHPVGFRWVMKAKERGARIIHVDPRYSRTSQLADQHVPIRAGSDIAFLGGLIHHVLETESYFRDYVVNYTNALDDHQRALRRTPRTSAACSPASIRRRGCTTGRRGCTRAARWPRRRACASTRRQAFAEKTGAGMLVGEVQRDDTLQDPRCVFQILRRHFSRYTPEMVERICGISQEDFQAVAEALVENSGRERTTAFCYAVGWTQHSAGVQMIRTAAILQLLLGNIGRPGGGILALRGHASIQGSTDIPTLYDLLPGYLQMPRAGEEELDLERYIATGGADRGWWSFFDTYIVSLLKAWFGDAATEENGYGFSAIPRISGNHSHFATMMRMLDGGVEGFFVMGQNPAVGSQHAGLQRRALARLKWLVVRDMAEIETATFWRDSPEVQSGELRPEDIQTEVFLMPAAAHVEKEGCFTNTQRLVQFRDKALEPPGDARSELWFMHHLAKRVKAHYAGSTAEARLADRQPALGLPRARGHPRARRRGRAEGDQRLRRRDRAAAVGVQRAAQRRLDGLRLLDLLGHLRRRRQPGPAARARRSEQGGRPRLARVGVGVAGEPPHALQPRVRRSGGTTRGASARSTCGGTPPRAAGPVTTSPTSRRTSRPTTARRRTPRAWTRSAGTTRSS